MSFFLSCPPQWAALLPGYLGFFDLADFRRSNAFLGYSRGDQEIAECDALLRQCVGNSALVERYGGGTLDEGMLWYKEDWHGDRHR
jgi:GGDEF domain-containing protein